ncbi:MAG TPA: GntR family transcriptional regulator [Nevskiaceae bacterium]|nr:GntR family transcriptional regulator [Nevskiaceae bacterium]
MDATATLKAGSTDTPDMDTQIYTSIRDAVLTQRLTSGSRLPELSLSKIYDVNRMMVRRTLERLAADHIVVLRRNQSAVVANPSATETRQVFNARRLVEAEVMRQTAGTISKTTRAKIESVIAHEHAAHLDGSHDDRIHLSVGFHSLLAAACPNHVLGEILDELVLRTSIAVALYKVPGMAVCYRSGDHQGIAQALFDDDADLAVKHTGEHLDYLEGCLNYATRLQKMDLASILAPMADAH